MSGTTSARRSLLDRFISPGFLESSGTRRRARHLAGSALAAFAGYAGASPVLATAGEPVLAGFTACTALLVGAHLYPLRRGMSLDLTANSFIAVSFPAFAGVTLLTGGAAPSFLFASAFIPLVALPLVGRGSATVWTALTCLYLLTTGVLSASGFEFPLQPDPVNIAATKFYGATILVLAAFGITWAQESARSRSDAEGEAARARSALLEHRLAMSEKRHLAGELAALGTMAGGVAHDFNNILTVMLGSADLIRATSTETDIRALGLDIQRQAERATALTTQLLRYTGNLQLSREQLDLWELTRKRAAGFSGANIEISLPETPAMVVGDAQLLRDALLGLIANAAEALDGPSGKISVTGGQRHLCRDDLSSLVLGDLCEEGPYLFIRVSDDGCGMDATEITKVFDPFYSKKSIGRGLGMSALLGIARVHAGALGLTSEPGLGTSVELFLPAATATTTSSAARLATAREQALAREPAGPTPRLLVVDDDDAVRELAVRLLRRHGFEVTGARDGVEALGHYRQAADAIDLVLLDFAMPGDDGPEVARQMLALDPTARILLMSGYPEHDTTHPHDESLFLGFLAKPYRAADLIARVEGALGSRPIASS